jgi:alpha-L-rhamnosidase
MNPFARILLKIVLLLIVGFASPSPLAVAAPSATATSLAPTRLRCEYLVDPLGINSTKPRLDWILKVNDPSARGLKQTAYQIRVASSSDILAKDEGDLWDSGKVQSDQTTFIEYAGSSLQSRESCWWKVRVWDGNGAPTAWSEPARWEMGLLKPDDWTAKWIDAPTITPGASVRGALSITHASYETTDGAGSKDVTGIVAGMMKDNSVAVPVRNDVFGGDPAFRHVKQLRVSYVVDGEKHETSADEGTTLVIPENRKALSYLRKDFTLGKPIVKARLYATALGLYELHLNGQRVGDHLFAPDWTDYNKRARYQVYDVTSLVKQGGNSLGGLVGNGWYSGHIGNGGFQAYGKVPALFAQLEVTCGDGSVDRVITDSTWKIHPSPILSSDNMLGENYDARQEIAGWDQPGLDISDWTAATERPESSHSLDGQVDQPVRETGELQPKAVTESKPGQWTFDLGQNMVGFVRLKVSASAGTGITLRHAEMLNPDGTIYTRNLRGAPSVDTYICKGGGVETWQPRFTFHGFRYVEVTGLPKAPANDTVTGIVVGTAIPRTGEFSCSNPDINQLQSNIQWGMRGNYLAVPTDCPQRDERMGWMGDAQVFIRTAAYNGDIAAFFTKWLVDVDDAQKPDGEFTDISPAPSSGRGGFGGVPAWGDAGVICPWTIYLMYGDKRILEQHLPAMARWVDWSKARATDLIRDRDRGPDYGDWLSQGESTQKDLLGTAYFAYSTSLVAKAYRVTGNTAAANKYEQLFELIKAAFNHRYVSADGHIQNGTQTDYCMALRFNLMPDDLRSKAAQYLADDVANHKDHLTTGFIGVSYLLPALCSEDKVDTAYRVFLQDTFPSWLFSVKHGATTIWERWDGWTPEKGFQDPGMNSFNHYSLGSCGEWMFDTVAGIGVDPDQPGFKHIIIRPRPGGNLTQAQGSFDSIRGKITTKWKLENGKFSLHVTIPANATATVYIPTSDPSQVKESGQFMAQVSETKILRTESSLLVAQIPGGSYRFTAPAPPKSVDEAPVPTNQ